MHDKNTQMIEQLRQDLAQSVLESQVTVNAGYNESSNERPVHRFDEPIDARDEDDCTAALIRGTLCRYTVASTCWARPRTRPRRRGQGAGGTDDTERVLAVSVSRIRYACPSCTRVI